MKKSLIIFGLALAMGSVCFGQNTPAERAQDLTTSRRAASYTVNKSEEVYLTNNILFELSAPGWAGLNLGRDKLLHNMSWWPRALSQYGKRIGTGDVEALDSNHNADGAAEAAQALRGKVTIHLKDDNVKWTQEKAENFVGYAGWIVDQLGDNYAYIPNNGVFEVTMLFTPKVSNSEVTVNKDGSLMVKVPSELWPSGWDTRIKAGLMKIGKYTRT